MTEPMEDNRNRVICIQPLPSLRVGSIGVVTDDRVFWSRRGQKVNIYGPETEPVHVARNTHFYKPVPPPDISADHMLIGFGSWRPDVKGAICWVYMLDSWQPSSIPAGLIYDYPPDPEVCFGYRWLAAQRPYEQRRKQEGNGQPMGEEANDKLAAAIDKDLDDRAEKRAREQGLRGDPEPDNDSPEATGSASPKGDQRIQWHEPVEGLCRDMPPVSKGEWHVAGLAASNFGWVSPSKRTALARILANHREQLGPDPRMFTTMRLQDGGIVHGPCVLHEWDEAALRSAKANADMEAR